jgi:hypothetical protein
MNSSSGKAAAVAMPFRTGSRRNAMPGKMNLITDRTKRYVAIAQLRTHYMLFGRMSQNRFLFEENL